MCACIQSLSLSHTHIGTQYSEQPQIGGTRGVRTGSRWSLWQGAEKKNLFHTPHTAVSAVASARKNRITSLITASGRKHSSCNIELCELARPKRGLVFTKQSTPPTL